MRLARHSRGDCRSDRGNAGAYERLDPGNACRIKRADGSRSRDRHRSFNK
jgi:hypothetical protein